jgi:hypothetical protein
MEIWLPIPNWTGFTLGFCAGTAIFWTFAVWLYKKDQKARQTNLDNDASNEVGHGGSSR